MSSVGWDDIPSDVRSSIARQMAKIDGLERSDVVERFRRILKRVTEEHGDKKNFNTPAKRKSLAGRILYGKLLRGGAGGQEYRVIPVGYSGVRDGPRANVFAFIRPKRGGSAEFNWILVKNQAAKNVSSINIFNLYRVNLNEWQGGYVAADDVNPFSDPQRAINSPREKLNKMLDIETVKVAEAEEHLSERNEQGYPIRTDWKHVRGIINNEISGESDKGPWAFYKVVDISVQEREVEAKDGQTFGPGLTVFCNPGLMDYKEESICDFYGTIQISQKTGLPVMNGYCILPYQAFRK